MEDRLLRDEIRAARIEAGLSLRGAERQSGVTAETISSVETGARTPHPQTLKKLADAYGVKISRFMLSREELVSPKV